MRKAFASPASTSSRRRNSKFIEAAEFNYQTVMRQYGQVPGGMFGADENARPGYSGPRQGAETCSMAEFMLSHEMLAKITGDARWADRTEEVAFNSLPASMTPDLKGLHYLTAPNMVQLDRASKEPGFDNRGDMLSYNPYQYRCCQHNVAHAWPYFAEHLWMATPGNGLAAVLYAPSEVKAKAGDGTEVRVVESTDYPFDGVVTFTIQTPKRVRFPLTLRVPEWTQAPKLTLNGRALRVRAASLGWLQIDHEWADGDRLTLELPMPVKVQTWTANRNSVSVYRGPLAYSLKIGERWRQYGSDPKWPAYEVFPTTAWNYALQIDPAKPAVSVKRAPGPLNPQPFTPENAPVSLTVKARRVPSWQLEANGLIQEVPQSPLAAAGPIEEVTLIPMGCARLRVSAFPRTGAR